jgi:predicted  nucleic acid-binding Zn-ribbon protein
MSNALHELTISLLKRQYEEELLKAKAERDSFMRKFIELKADYEKVSLEKSQMLRQLRFICERVDVARMELEGVCYLPVKATM